MKTSTRKAVKAIVEITTQELFNNWAASTVDVLWDKHHEDITEVLADPLEAIHREYEEDIRKLFKDSTPMLLGKAFEDVEKADCCEVIITKRDGTTFIVTTEDMDY